MRFYGKKILRGMIGRTVAAKSESRDAILWDVLAAQRLCRVKIQGSGELIIAKYPENWEATPWWLKPGNAVRITHPGGERGRIEIFGPGAAIPTPVSGSTFPTIGEGEDAVLAGCHVTECYNNPRMAVLVHTGTFRIGGVIYTLGEIAMNSDVFAMGDGGAMGNIAGAMAVNAAPSAGLFRYDLISLGTDLAIDYTPGTAAAVPTKPTPAANHVALAYLMISSGVSAVTSSMINSVWTSPAPAYLSMEIADNQLAWGESSTAVILKVFDQYGGQMELSGGVFQYSLEITSGNGRVWSTISGYSTTKVYQQSGGAGPFIYYRNGTTEDLSPVLRGTVYLEKDMTVDLPVLLYDSEGTLMIEHQ